MFPRLSPLTLFVSMLAWAAFRALLTSEHISTEVLHADIFGGLLVGTIANFVTRLLGNDPGTTGATVGRAIINLQKDLGDVGGSLRNFVGEMRGWLGSLVGLLKSFKDSALIPMLRWLKEKIVWLKTWLRKFLGPTIDFLLKVRKKLLELYAKYVRPVLDMIEIARFFLKTLDRLGVKWAGELERRLGQVESAITRNFQILLGALNRAIGVIDSIVTLDLLFQRIPFLRTLVREIKSVWNLTLASRMGVGDDSADAIRRQSGTLKTPEKIEAAYDAYMKNGSGDFRASIAEWSAWFDARLLRD